MNRQGSTRPFTPATQRLAYSDRRRSLSADAAKGAGHRATGGFASTSSSNQTMAERSHRLF